MRHKRKISTPLPSKVFNSYLCSVRKVLSLIFLFIFLSAYTAFGEVLKLPLLIHHYIEHVQEDNDLSIVDFLVKHYSGKIQHHHKENNHEHEKLPFKSSDSHFTHIVSTIPQPAPSQTITITTKLKKTIHSQQDYSNACLNNIWQPPRFS